MGMETALPKLLVVDDVNANIRAIERSLEVLDIEMIPATSGQDALSSVLEHDFFAILLDVQMPEMDGFEVATILSENPQTQHIPIIFITAISKSEHFVLKGYKTGAVDYLTKPFDEEVLLSKVNVFLNLHLKEQELIYVNNKLKRFTSSASHDLKAPLRHINAYTKMIIEDNEGKLDEETRNNLEAINKTSKRLFDLIGDLLDYARFVRKDVPMEKVNLGKVIAETIEDLGALSEECSAEIIVNDLPSVSANAVYMRQVFQNLISNSLKYRKKDVAPVIEINCEKINEGQNFCKITVKDNGIGFDQKYAAKVFVAFQRLVANSEYEGSGVGLATVYEIVTACGGDISASSVKGEGSTFTVILPLS